MDECDNFFCLYWMANRCLLSYITLDSCGCCENCIHMELPEPLIHRWRLDQLRKLENRTIDGTKGKALRRSSLLC